MSDVTDPWVAVETILKLFYPQYFDPTSPDYVDNAIMQQLDIIAQEARPWCLPVNAQNLAEAMYLAYLITLRNQTSSGQGSSAVAAGPVISEKEGDISVTYADMTKMTSGVTPAGMSQRPPSDPWDAWNRLWTRCAQGAILTRYGDPCRNAINFNAYAVPLALDVWSKAA